MPFVDEVLGLFGDHQAECLASRDRDDACVFGDAAATVEVGGLRLHFVRDRGLVSVEVGLRPPDDVVLNPALQRYVDGLGAPVCPCPAMPESRPSPSAATGASAPISAALLY